MLIYEPEEWLGIAISPTYITSLNWPYGQLGLGASWKYLYSSKSNGTTPKTPNNGLYTIADFPEIPEILDTNEVDGKVYVIQSYHPGGPISGSAAELEGLQDSTGSNPFYSLDTSGNYLYDHGVTYPWHFDGLNVVAFASFSPNQSGIIPFLKKEDLKIFAEIAVIGWENQPLYYTDRSERMPFTLGIYLPGFMLLDKFSWEWEYFNFRGYTDLNYYVYPSYSSLSSPTVVTGLNHFNTHWSLYGDRTLGRNWKISFQILKKVYLPNQNTTFATAIPQGSPHYFRYQTGMAVNLTLGWKF